MNNEKYYLIKITFSYYLYIKYMIERHEEIRTGNINNFEYEYIKEFKNLSYGFLEFTKKYKYDKNICDENENNFERYLLIYEKYGKKYIEMQSLPDVKTVSNNIKVKIFEKCIKYKEICNKNNVLLKRLVNNQLNFNDEVKEEICESVCINISQEIDKNKKGFRVYNIKHKSF